MVDYNKEMFNSIESNQPHLFKQHVEAGAEINSRNSDNRTALHVSIFKRSDEISKEILSKLEPELGAKGKYEGTPLHMAAFMDDLYSAEKIIEILKAGEGISVIDQKDMNGNTAFHLACMYGRLEIAHLILKKQLHPNRGPTLSWTRLGKPVLVNLRKGRRKRLLNRLKQSENSLTPGPIQHQRLFTSPQ